MKTKMISLVIMAYLLTGCQKDDTKEAIKLFTNRCEGSINATLTIGTFANSLSLSCEVKK